MHSGQACPLCICPRVLPCHCGLRSASPQCSMADRGHALMVLGKRTPTRRLSIYDATASVGVPSPSTNQCTPRMHTQVCTLRSRVTVLVWVKVGCMYPCYITDTCATVACVSGRHIQRCHRSTRVDGALHSTPCTAMPSDRSMRSYHWHGRHGVVWSSSPHV